MTSSEGRAVLVLGLVLVLASGCGDKDEVFDCDEDYSMEAFWTDYHTIYCAYEGTCTTQDPEGFDAEECVESRVSTELHWCDESGFDPCASWECIVAWRAEVDALEAEGRLGECDGFWNLPTRGACDGVALMYWDCNTVVDE